MRSPAIDTTVLVVDDDRSVTEVFASALDRQGFTVEVAHTGRLALSCIAAAVPDVVVLDLVLPDVSGIAVCAEIRSRSSVPILMISGRNSEVDVVAALDAGADDYLVKPFGVAELVARIRATLRRATPTERSEDDVVRVGILTLAPRRGQAWLRGQSLSLPAKEFAVLEALVRTPDRVVTRSALSRAAWGPDRPVSAKALDATVRRLRQRLGTSAGTIVTVRGLGFRFEPA